MKHWLTSRYCNDFDGDWFKNTTNFLNNKKTWYTLLLHYILLLWFAFNIYLLRKLTKKSEANFSWVKLSSDVYTYFPSERFDQCFNHERKGQGMISMILKFKWIICFNKIWKLILNIVKKLETMPFYILGHENITLGVNKK